MRSADVVIIGGGLVGLAVAGAAGARGAAVVLVSESRPGEASPAGAGMLAPGAEGDELPGAAVVRFALAARDLYPSYLASLREQTGIDVPLYRNGILELMAAHPDGAIPEQSEWLDARALHALEPAIGDFAGALLHHHDGSVDNVILLEALRRRAHDLATVAMIAGSARAVDVTGSRPRVTLASGETLEGGALVIAGGAWSGAIAGLPRAVPVHPVRGQMLSVSSTALGHATYGAGGYLVPRTDGRTLVGATMERVGFDSATTAAGAAALAAIAARIAPAIVSAPRIAHWAGLRPLTPDHLPILGADPDVPSLFYACGHGRNGILLAPITGTVVGALVCGEASPYDLSPFGIARFAADD
jgi:glycine oxidase ThiO